MTKALQDQEDEEAIVESKESKELEVVKDYLEHQELLDHKEDKENEDLP